MLGRLNYHASCRSYEESIENWYRDGSWRYNRSYFQSFWEINNLEKSDGKDSILMIRIINNIQL